MISTKGQNKILIVAESNNNSLKRILLWLLNFDFEIVRLNSEIDKFKIESIDLSNKVFKFSINDSIYSINDFNKIYFHRGALQLEGYTGVKSFKEGITDFKSAFEYYRMAYEISLREILFDNMHLSKTIGSDNGGRINKVKMLQIAKESGFNIPETILTCNKTELKQFLTNNNNNIISKSLDLNFIFDDIQRSKLVHGLTCQIVEDDLSFLPETFPLTLFQENISKLLELRVFFIGDKNFCSAILSQNSDLTKQDYRNYDEEFPNRVVPFRLPDEINICINNFKMKSKLKTGSIDILLSENNMYYFLEVNPQGQFIGVSDYCNYYLEKEVAEFLIS